MSCPTVFLNDATTEIKEYMRENEQWRDANEEDLEEFKQEIINTLFIEGLKFYTLQDCLDYVGNDASVLAEVIDYTLDRNDDFDDKPKTVVEMFNKCWYFAPDFIYGEEEWNELVESLDETTDEDTDEDTDEEMEG